MTQQEAEEWATRLTRIWCCENVDVCFLQKPNYQVPNSFDYKGHIRDDVYLAVESIDELSHLTLMFDLHIGEMYLTANEVQGLVDIFDYCQRPAVEVYRDRIDEWMPFFRRGCWLSGCPIEATAHEKTEWIQGFCREELESWNLKM